MMYGNNKLVNDYEIMSIYLWTGCAMCMYNVCLPVCDKYMHHLTQKSAWKLIIAFKFF